MNILIIDDDHDFCNTLKSLLAEHISLSSVTTTDTVSEATHLILSEIPTALILNLELQKANSNGLSVLKMVSEIDISLRPYTIVITNNISPRTLDIVRKLGADYIMLKNKTDFSPETILELLTVALPLFEDTSSEVRSNNSNINLESNQIRYKIDSEFNRIGISPKLIGYQYLSEAILLVLNGYTNNIASTISVQHQKTEASVSRAMQTAIEHAWKISDTEYLQKYYTARINSDKGIPTPLEFVYYYANKLRVVCY